MYIYIYIYIYIHTYIHIGNRPRENMVGVNMVLAWWTFIPQDLYNICLNLMNSARTMFTPTMFSRRRGKLRSRPEQHTVLPSSRHSILYYRIVNIMLLHIPEKQRVTHPLLFGQPCGNPRVNRRQRKGCFKPIHKATNKTLRIRGNHLSNTTCLTHVFFKSGEYNSKVWWSFTRRNAHQTNEAALDE